ncbi:hypothetical protein BJ322DRAFT_1095452 [Thelephora terrestris]|uniref:F-box domain-containing protein n=1 Tax=Thelephora terrestris TaxID=56493 RepID=A0A9P6H1Z8_9AGAM|nr:hypothetical protein BJ322DRAFT_1095452 [Thelephora terrestris]
MVLRLIITPPPTASSRLTFPSSHHSTTGKIRHNRTLPCKNSRLQQHLWKRHTSNRSILSQLWCRTKTKTKLLFSSGATKASRTTIVHPSPFGKLPQEIVEEILSYFICDIRNLLACSLTCHSWYLATFSHLHYSLTTDESPYASEDKNYHWPGPLEKMYEFGLLRLVKRFRIRHWYGGRRFTPEDFSGRNLYYFSALENLQELGIDNLQVSATFSPWVMGHMA